jgi:TetR/AcrR family transcriptional repressor of mexJK operon
MNAAAAPDSTRARKGRGRPVDPRKDRLILTVARRLLVAQGPRALTMDAVARAAQISKATLYARYHNRTALLAAVVERESPPLDRALAQFPPTDRRALRTALQRFVAALVAFLASPRHARLMHAMGQMPARAGDLATVYRNGPQRTHEGLAAYLQRAARQGLIVCADPPRSAELLLGMAMGLDLVRSLYRVPRQHATAAARARHARRIVAAFLTLHAAPAGDAGGRRPHGPLRDAR